MDLMFISLAVAQQVISMQLMYLLIKMACVCVAPFSSHLIRMWNIHIRTLVNRFQSNPIRSLCLTTFGHLFSFDKQKWREIRCFGLISTWEHTSDASRVQRGYNFPVEKWFTGCSLDKSKHISGQAYDSATPMQFKWMVISKIPTSFNYRTQNLVETHLPASHEPVCSPNVPLAVPLFGFPVKNPKLYDIACVCECVCVSLCWHLRKQALRMYFPSCNFPRKKKKNFHCNCCSRRCSLSLYLSESSSIIHVVDDECVLKLIFETYT